MKRYIKRAVVGMAAAAILASFAPIATVPVSAATVTKETFDFSNMTIRRVWFNTLDPTFLIDNYQRVWLDENVNVLATGTQTDVSSTSNLMAPMKEMFAQIGADYTEVDNDIIIQMNGMTVKFKVGSDDVEVDGKVLSNALTAEQIPVRVNVKETYAAYNTYLTEDYYVTYLPVAYVLNTFQADIYSDSNMKCFYAAIPVFHTENVPSYSTSSEGYGNRYDALLEGTLALSTEVADNLVALQNEDGGFQTLPENVELSQANLASKLGTMKDSSSLENGATTAELKYLAAYITANQPTDGKYVAAFQKGVNFLVKSQLDNGGWTMEPNAANGFNGNVVVGNDCMTEVLSFLSDIAVLNNQNYVFARKTMDVTAMTAAVNKGTEYLVSLQVENAGKKSGWATQYTTENQVTMGRTYERESVSAFTTKAVVAYLMTIHNPSDAVKAAVDSAVAWLAEVKLADKSQEIVRDTSMNNGFDVFLVDGDGTWANQYVYDEATNAYRPMYSDIDPTRPDQPYVNIYEVDTLSRKGTTADSTDLILYATRTSIEYYNNTLATALIATDYENWKTYVTTGFPALPVDPADPVTPNEDPTVDTDTQPSTQSGTQAGQVAADTDETANSNISTGDGAPVVMLFVLLFGAAATAGVCVYKKRKRML